MAKDKEILADEVTLLTAENCTLRKANEDRGKHRGVTRTRVREKFALAVEDEINVLTIKRQRCRCDTKSDLGKVDKMRGN